jgi:folate-binding protein YgfZ
VASLFEQVTGVSAGVVDLAARGRIRMTGRDRVRFLDGMVTNSVATVEDGGSCRALLLDRKGRILSDLEVIQLEPAVWIETAEGTGATVHAALERHIIADAVELEDLTDGWAELAVEGPAAGEAVLAAGGEAPAPGKASEQRGRVWIGGGAVDAQGVRLLATRSEVETFRSSLELAAVSQEQLEILRVEAYRPAYGVDATERSFPAEGPYRAAVSFTKGCYIGQEIVARVDSRGGVNRLLVKLGMAEPTSAGSAITAAGTAVGVVTSAVCSPLSGPLALGYVKTELAEPGAKLEVDGASAVVLEIPEALNP